MEKGCCRLGDENGVEWLGSGRRWLAVFALGLRQRFCGYWKAKVSDWLAGQV